MSRYGMWKPYVPVAERRRSAAKEIEKLKGDDFEAQPVTIEGGAIARTFWGKAWCDHLESYSDYSNRLPRGRTYVRNGSVLHLFVSTGSVDALVSGSSLYRVKITIPTLSTARWTKLKKNCAGRIGSLVGLLNGELSADLMSVVTDRAKGLFPAPKEISLDCSCPDWATMCKHVAAVLYGVGSRLDECPELLFLLRGVDHEDLIATGTNAVLSDVNTATGSSLLPDEDLSDIFGIDLGAAAPTTPATPKRSSKKRTKSRPPTKPKRKKAASKQGTPAIKKKTLKAKSPGRKRGNSG